MVSLRVFTDEGTRESIVEAIDNYSLQQWSTYLIISKSKYR
jgi:hypothetical protein